MAAGGLLGGLVGNSIGKQNRPDVVYVQPAQPQVVYSQRPSSEAERLRLENEELLKQENAALRERLRRLEAQ